MPGMSHVLDGVNRCVSVCERGGGTCGRLWFLLRQICLLAGRGNKLGRSGWGEGNPGE